MPAPKPEKKPCQACHSTAKPVAMRLAKGYGLTKIKCCSGCAKKTDTCKKGIAASRNANRYKAMVKFDPGRQIL
jgi:hypothetical protein